MDSNFKKRKNFPKMRIQSINIDRTKEGNDKFDKKHTVTVFGKSKFKVDIFFLDQILNMHLEIYLAILKIR